MKRLTVAWLSAFLFIGSALTSYAQTNSPIPERDSSSVSLFEYATKIPKRNKVFNLGDARRIQRGLFLGEAG